MTRNFPPERRAAADFALDRAFAGIRGRKAMILFTDGIDTAGETATRKSTRDAALESEVLIYPIRYDSEALFKNGKFPSRQAPSPATINAPPMTSYIARTSKSPTVAH